MALADFIPVEGQQRIAQAITEAERHTSGEICVHVTPHCRGDVVQRAAHTFNRLGLYATRRRNAVLVFVPYKDRRVAIVGDAAINEAVPEGFWNDEVVLLAQRLKAGRPIDGLCETVMRLGEQLAAFFPADRTNPNELSNEVTYDDNHDESDDHDSDPL